MQKVLFTPRQSILFKAIITQGNLATWLLPTKDNVLKYLMNTEASAPGHIDQQRKNIQSTKVQQTNEDEEQDKDIKTDVVFPSILNSHNPPGKLQPCRRF